MKKIFLVFTCLIFASCAAKQAIPIDFDAGVPTLNNLSRGELNLACDDAKYLVGMFMNYDGIIFEYTAVQIAYPDNAGNYDESKKKLFRLVADEYQNFQERILAPYRNNKDAFAKVLSTVINTDAQNVFSASFINYLGLTNQNGLDNYINATFCGDKKVKEFLSPSDIDNNQMELAIVEKLKKLKK